ncbi:hypothetical protein HETIRDRAFT_434594 [Heterobasidion irregulare TC 32-1]|uniref:Peptidase C14 caspase domain-containing protein n=1 Tax=Heterobasidion irregulare (strain TC 32-1) TaxID=747525 RepID=W4K3V3_HETIT|nr:uncharacterized protein HETIRDRAFT_434594 [Heterobasidion irregulare TC 32-1]ETW80513.1 hypothetical protein HETIRDRAFT_434594 [Heterobasidion irregulare TC 32-1]
MSLILEESVYHLQGICMHHPAARAFSMPQGDCYGERSTLVTLAFRALVKNLHRHPCWMHHFLALDRTANACLTQRSMFFSVRCLSSKLQAISSDDPPFRQNMAPPCSSQSCVTLNRHFSVSMKVDITIWPCTHGWRHHDMKPHRIRKATVAASSFSEPMAARVFALIIGVDQYKSSRIWNLSSCVDDAQNIKRWLLNDLHVPRDQICILLDDKATKRAIEDCFMSHLVSNAAIEPGDAILVYFAGHGSRLLAPEGWYNASCARVEMLCPHDHDTRSWEGRVSGITDWSMHAMMQELCSVKGDNITLILDCCFSPTPSRMNIRSRRCTRWTPTVKVTSDDLYAGLWRGALGSNVNTNGQGFCQRTAPTHITLLACGAGERAMEDKEGGKFTGALLEAMGKAPIHYESQHAICAGQNYERTLSGIEAGWARITKWNNRPPFRIHLKKTCSSFMQWWNLRRKLPSKMEQMVSTGGLNIVRVKKASHADVSLQRLEKHIVVEHHDPLIAANCPRIVHIPVNDMALDTDIIDAAARFHLQLHRKNSHGLLCDKLSMSLYRLDGDEWSKAGDNLLIEGRANLSVEKGTIYSVVLENQSNIDLWPYLFWMDASGYIISSVYQPDPSIASAPLAKRSHLQIGTGFTGSEALSFNLLDNDEYSSGFLKLFVSTNYVPMSIVEQGSNMGSGDAVKSVASGAEEPLPDLPETSKELWDTLVACVTIFRGEETV